MSQPTRLETSTRSLRNRCASDVGGTPGLNAACEPALCRFGRTPRTRARALVTTVVRKRSAQCITSNGQGHRNVTDNESPGRSTSLAVGQCFNSPRLIPKVPPISDDGVLWQVSRTTLECDPLIACGRGRYEMNTLLNGGPVSDLSNSETKIDISPTGFCYEPGAAPFHTASLPAVAVESECEFTCGYR